MPRGAGAGMQPGGRVPSPLVNKSTSMNSKLLPQGSGGIISGRTSALLQGSNPPPARPFSLGLEPTAQVPVPARPVPAAALTPVEKPVAPAAKMNPDDLRRKTVSLLEEYYSVRLLDEALQCVEELRSPSYHPEVVKEAISIALEKSPPCVEPVAKLLDYLLLKKVLAPKDVGTGVLLYASMLDDIGIDLPKAPNNFGEIIGKLILAMGLDFAAVQEVLKKIEDDRFRKVVMDSAVRTVSSSPSGQSVLDSQAAEIEACQNSL